MRKKIQDVLEKGIKLEFKKTLLFVNEDLSLSVSDAREAIKEMELNTISSLNKRNGHYYIIEFRDSDEYSHTLMGIESYRKRNPQDWIRLKDALRKYYPEVLKDMREYHEKSIYQ